MTITRSPGIAVGGYIVGGGYSGASPRLDRFVDRSAKYLAERFEMPVQIRFNSDRQSGGAWLVTDEVDGIWRNCSLGICWGERNGGQLYGYVYAARDMVRDPDRFDNWGNSGRRSFQTMSFKQACEWVEANVSFRAEVDA